MKALQFFTYSFVQQYCILVNICDGHRMHNAPDTRKSIEKSQKQTALMSNTGNSQDVFASL